MFIDLTRHGGDRLLRVAAAAIAYLDDAGDSTAVHLMGGQSLRVIEPIATIEERIAGAYGAGLETASLSDTSALDALAAIKGGLANAEAAGDLEFRKVGTGTEAPTVPPRGRKAR